MFEAISLTDAIERSFRIDMALKKAYLKALEALYSGVKEVADENEAKKSVAQVYLGTIYLGGDDGLIFTPSWIAPIFANFLAEEFSRQLGLVRGLSIAIAAGPAKMNVWSLIDCANSLLEIAKNSVRKLVEKIGIDGTKVGAIVFDFYETGSPSGSSAVERLSYLSDRVANALGLSEIQIKKRRFERRIDSNQPYFITIKDVPETWRTVFKVLYDVENWSHDKSFEIHKRALGNAYLTSRASDSVGKNEKEKLKSLRNIIMYACEAVSDSPFWREKLYIYILKQKSKENKESGTYEALVKFIDDTFTKENFKGPIPIADLIILIKLLKGGVW